MSTSFDEIHGHSQILLKRLKATLNLIDDAVVWTNVQGLIEQCNSAFEQLVCCPSEQLWGQPLMERLPLQQQGRMVAAAEHPVNRFLSNDLEMGEHYEFNQKGCLQFVEIANIDSEEDAGNATASSGKGFVIRAVPALEQTRPSSPVAMSEELYQLAFDSTQIGSLDWDAQTNIARIDGNAAVALGLKPDQSQIGYQVWRACIHPKDIDCIEQIRSRALAKRESYEVEYRAIHPDGTIRWLLSRERGKYNAEGNLERVVGVIVDISEHKRDEVVRRLTETAWQENQQLLNTIISNLGGGVSRCLYHTDGCFSFAYASSAYQELLELSLQEIAIQPCRVFARFHPDDYAAWQVMVQTAQRNLEPVYLEYRVILPSGEERWLARTARFAWGTDQDLIVDAIDIDITNHKQTEQALRAAESQFWRLTENVPGIIYRYVISADNQGSFTYVSSQCRKICGVDAASILENHNLVWSLVHPDDQEPLRAAITTAAQTLAPWQSEFRIVTSDGQTRWIRTVAQAEQQANGDILWDGLCEDVTARKQAEACIQQQQDFLRAVIDINPNLIFVKDSHGSYLLANQAIADAYNVTVESLRGQRLTDVYPDHQIAAEFVRQNRQIIDTLQPMFIPEEHMVSHSEQKWFQWQKQPIYLPEQQSYGVLGVGVDITERKQAEAALRNLVQGTASATGDAFFPVLVESLASALNVRHALVSELSQGYLHPLAFWSNHLRAHPSFAVSDISCCQATLEQGFYCCPSQVQQASSGMALLADLEAESYLGVVMLNESGQPIGMLCILDDKPLQKPAWAEAILRIFAARAAAELERQRATTALQQLNQELEARVEQRSQQLIQSQAALQASESLFRRIFEHAPLAMTLTDAKTQRMLKVNAAYRQMFGYSATEIAELTAADWLHLVESEAELQQIQRVIEGETSYFQVEKRYLKQNGETIWGNLTAALIQDQNGGLLYRLEMLEDITDRKQAEAQLNASLEEKEVLLKEVHHRVKNNLQMIQSLLNLQARSIEEPSILEALADSQKRIKAMATVHEKLYQSNRLSHINFADYVQDLSQDLLQSYVLDPAMLQLSIEVEALELTLDTAISCGLIINELFSNAIKYAFPNGRRGVITIQFQLDSSNRYRLLVADDGVGIPAAIAPQTTKSLGLRLVYALTRQLQGSLVLDRSAGSKFTITFAKPV